MKEDTWKTECKGLKKMSQVPAGKEREKQAKEILEEIMAENFLELVRQYSKVLKD